MAKFYAVKKGRQEGIYLTWDECKKQVNRYPGAIYKSFPSLQAAKAFIEGKTEIDNRDGLMVYVDGSFNAKTKEYGYGCVLIDHQKVIKEVYGKGNHKDFVSMRNVSGEIFGCLAALELALTYQYQHVYIYYDYEGIEKWATGAWQTYKAGTKYYKDKIEEYKKQISITFIKVAAHSGDFYNERVDMLAKKAVGLWRGKK